MPRRKSTKRGEPPAKIQGWAAIAKFLGVSTATAQHWAKTGMPVRRQGRYTAADPNEIRQWLGREAHMPAPAEVLTPSTDISAALKRSLSAIRQRKRK